MKKLFIYLTILLTAFGCKEKYVSPVVSPTTGYLVVEGMINAGGGQTQIILTRTSTLDNPVVIYEKGAKISVLGDDNSTVSLNESSAGIYLSAPTVVLNNKVKYKIAIQTADGKTYQSDFSTVQATPTIDSVYWKRENNGVQFYVNTHDLANATQYYEWDFTETWEYHSPLMQYFQYYQSGTRYPNIPYYQLKYIDPVFLTFNMALYKCYTTQESSTIILSSTTNLTQNKINHPLNYIPAGSVKIGEVYSVLTRQYGISENKYRYLEKMKKNTEATGSIFDAQPSELVGNVHSTSNPSEIVIGFVDASMVQSKRSFIKNTELKDWNYASPCVISEIKNSEDSITKVHNSLLPGTAAKYSPFGGILSYYFATPECVDCRILHGTNVKPSYWPN